MCRAIVKIGRLDFVCTKKTMKGDGGVSLKREAFRFGFRFDFVHKMLCEFCRDSKAELAKKWFEERIEVWELGS